MFLIKMTYFSACWPLLAHICYVGNVQNVAADVMYQNFYCHGSWYHEKKRLDKAQQIHEILSQPLHMI